MTTLWRAMLHNWRIPAVPGSKTCRQPNRYISCTFVDKARTKKEKKMRCGLVWRQLWQEILLQNELKIQISSMSWNLVSLFLVVAGCWCGTLNNGPHPWAFNDQRSHHEGFYNVAKERKRKDKEKIRYYYAVKKQRHASHIFAGTDPFRQMPSFYVTEHAFSTGCSRVEQRCTIDVVAFRSFYGSNQWRYCILWSSGCIYGHGCLGIGLLQSSCPRPSH